MGASSSWLPFGPTAALLELPLEPRANTWCVICDGWCRRAAGPRRHRAALAQWLSTADDKELAFMKKGGPIVPGVTARVLRKAGGGRHLSCKLGPGLMMSAGPRLMRRGTGSRTSAQLQALIGLLQGHLSVVQGRSHGRSRNCSPARHLPL